MPQSMKSMLHPVVEAWFQVRFGAPTAPQTRGWPEIAAKNDTLIAAPTGSGKTLAAFLIAIDGLFRQAAEGTLADGIQVVYVSPLKALANDVHKNLDEPLAEIAAAAAEHGLLAPPIRSATRSGDTLAAARQAMLRRPPHILVTTPESLYILLTSAGGRRMLKTTRTVIVDEVHALAGNKRGAHLALTLERLDELVELAGGVQRVGLSATAEPIDEIAAFLGGARPRPTIVAVADARRFDLAVEVPASELGPIATNEQWEERYERLAELARAHHSTLVFVSTRRMAERVAHRMRERLGEEAVAAHHGSLSRTIRLRAEERFKAGELKMMVATASLELGLDIGAVDLVCQIGSTRQLASAWQRVGRAGHWKGATPKGRFFALTRDDLIECAALVRGIHQRALDRIRIPPWPRDILAQQIVATVASIDASSEDPEGWGEDALYAAVRRAWPYRALPRPEFDAIVALLAEGISSRRGRRGALLHRDGVHHRLRPRRGTRWAAITSGGAIAETAAYLVQAEPENLTIGTLDEDFAIESNAGDVILLGTHSWKVRGIETGRVRVEDAHGAPPTVPFWLGEAPGRTQELSALASQLREEIANMDEDAAGRLLEAECGLDPVAARQTWAYCAASAATLGAVPTARHLVAERFFDDGGGMQLVIHAPFGSAINKAWGMALRKRFCRGFDFELQASASENGLALA
ncbi:MAG TPA: DEAD/DEAH box helicase, partial [Terriglobales bacterium]|nr:DEAD/DEAH box helicase [Terriglobales bacterium]